MGRSRLVSLLLPAPSKCKAQQISMLRRRHRRNILSICFKHFKARKSGPVHNRDACLVSAAVHAPCKTSQYEQELTWPCISGATRAEDLARPSLTHTFVTSDVSMLYTTLSCMRKAHGWLFMIAMMGTGGCSGYAAYLLQALKGLLIVPFRVTLYTYYPHLAQPFARVSWSC